MKNKQIATLLFTIGISLIATTSAKAGLEAPSSSPNDLQASSCLAIFYSAPNDLPDLSSIEMFYSAPNDSPNLPHTEYFTLASGPINQIAVDESTFSNTHNWAKDSTKHSFVKQVFSDNSARHMGLLSNWPDSLYSKSQNINKAVDFNRFGLGDKPNDSPETTQATDQDTPEFRSDTDYNDFIYYTTPAATPKNQPSLYNHSP
jgi:hypothetical protein